LDSPVFCPDLRMAWNVVLLPKVSQAFLVVVATEELSTNDVWIMSFSLTHHLAELYK
jgi:hypothetical protein